MKRLETDILNLFQEKGKDAYDDLKIHLSPTAKPKKRALIRHILSRLELNNDGTYFLK